MSDYQPVFDPNEPRDLSKKSVETVIKGRAPAAGLLGPATPSPRDPLAMRARIEYNLYVEQQQLNGMPAAPFEVWQKQRLSQPAPQAPMGPGLLGPAIQR